MSDCKLSQCIYYPHCNRQQILLKDMVICYVNRDSGQRGNDDATLVDVETDRREAGR